MERSLEDLYRWREKIHKKQDVQREVESQPIILRNSLMSISKKRITIPRLLSMQILKRSSQINARK
jgi:hypothetical protein